MGNSDDSADDDNRDCAMENHEKCKVVKQRIERKTEKRRGKKTTKQ